MRLGVKINLENFEQLTIMSGECDTYEECEAEIINALRHYDIESVMRFKQRMFEHRERENIK